jgi:hypothetical protein
MRLTERRWYCGVEHEGAGIPPRATRGPGMARGKLLLEAWGRRIEELTE